MKKEQGIGPLSRTVRRCLAKNQITGRREVDYPNGIRIVGDVRDGITERVWPIYNSPMTGEIGYEGTFEKVLKGKTIAGVVNEIKERNGEVAALDLMGSGLQELGIDHLLAVRLGINSDFVYEGEIVQGDIFRRSTWNEIRNLLKTRDKRHFDLVVCRPCGGLDILPYNLGVFNSLASRVWSLLSPNNGIFLSQLPSGNIFSNDPEIQNVLPVVSTYLEREGIFFQWADPSPDSINKTQSYFTIMMTKTSCSPEKFPEIPLGPLVDPIKR